MAIVNCTITYLTASLLGRVALGEGVLQYAVYEMEELAVLDPWSFHPNIEGPIIEAFSDLRRRPIESVETEMRQEDRRGVDDIVFEALGLTQTERDAVYEAVAHLVAARLSKAEAI